MLRKIKLLSVLGIIFAFAQSLYANEALNGLEHAFEKIKSHNPQKVTEDEIQGVFNPTIFIPERKNVKLPFEMSAIPIPEFKNETYDIRNYGAQSGGDFLNTEAIAKAIADCTKNGGGTVVVPPGRWLTGPITLKSYVNLHVSEGAEVSFSEDRSLYRNEVLVRYQGVELYNYTPFIYAYNCENIAITGEGVLQGNGKNWWPYDKKREVHWKEMIAAAILEQCPVSERKALSHGTFNPSFIHPVHCKNVLIEGVTVKDGAFWTVHPVYCENLTIRKIEVFNNGGHGDGINPDSCKNVLIERCYVNTRNDCITIKSGLNEDGWRVGKPCENIVIRYVYAERGYGGVVLGSEISGDVRNLFVHDCILNNTDRGIRIKTRTGRGGELENLYFDSIFMPKIKRQPILINMRYASASTNMPEGYTNTALTAFHDFYFSNIYCHKSKDSIVIQGKEKQKVKNIFFEEITMNSVNGKRAEFAENIQYKNVEINLLEK